jgi:hypothetical protein
MKHLLLIFLASYSISVLNAQEQSVTIKEPVEQCYQDLKATLPVIRFDDQHMTVVSRPLLTYTSGSTGNLEMVVRLFPEKNDTECKLVVAFSSPEHSAAWNAMGSNYLWRNAHTMAGKIESVRKSREKAEKKAAKQ